MTHARSQHWCVLFVQRMLFALLLALHAVELPAQTPGTMEDAKAMDLTLDTIEQGLKQGTTDSALNITWLQQAGALRDHARDCIVDTQGKLAESLLKIQTLGAAVPGEARDVTRARAALNTSKTDAEKLLSSCRLLILRSDDLLKKAGALQQQLMTRRLLARGPSVNTLLRENLRQAPDWIAASQEYLSTRSGVEQLNSDDALSLLGLSLLGLVIGLTVCRRLRRNRPDSAEDNAPGSTLYRAAAQVLVHYLPALLPSLLIAAYFYAAGHTQPVQPLLYLAAYGLPIYILLLCLFRLFIVTGTTSVCLALSEPIAKALMRRLGLLALLLYVGYLLFATVFEQALPEPALLLLRAVFIVVFALNLVWALWLLGHVPYFNTVRWPRRSVELTLLLSVAAEWLGYRILSQATLRGLFGTLLLLGLAMLLSRLMHEFYDGLDSGTHRWQQRLRGALGIKPGGSVPGLAWLRPLTTLAIVTACLLGVLWTWGLSDIGFQQLHDYLLEGIAVGSLHIVPGRIALAALILTLLLGFSGWFKGQLERNWLQGTNMERSAREALVTITGYTGTAIAVLVALSIAGMEFKNLAILAGALSVGIGFGLQNIVNNFVSGLILLFERPIKTGDWIVVGDTEGYVKRISIRSTRIQTFDHADVIVPNSELISGRVTNWTLADKHGRIRVPVRVAFAGNDPEVIKRLLLEAAQAHSMVLKEPGLEPTVLFVSFVDASLLFELRCFIANVNKGGQVISDLNFAIDAAFRANGVFPPGAPAPAVR